MRLTLPLSALLLASSALPALALTPQQVWAEWQALAAQMGKDITVGTVEDRGDVLRLRDLSATLGDEAAMAVRFAIEDITLTAKGDQVEITRSPEITLAGAGFGPDGAGPGQMSGRITSQGQSAIAEGRPGAITYRYQSEEVRFETLMDVAGPEPFSSRSEGSLRGLSGLISNLPGSLEAPGELASTIAAMAIASETSQGTLSSRTEATYEDITSSGAVWLVDHPLFPVGFQGRATMGRNAQRVQSDTPQGPIRYAVSQEGAAAELGFVPDGALVVKAQGGAAQIEVSPPGDSIPDLSFLLEGSMIDLAMPLDLSSGPQPFHLTLDLGPLSLGEEVWALFDPEGHIDRSPGRLSLDLGGSVTEAPAMPEMGALPELIDIKALTLALGGATLSGSGAFTFPPEPPLGAPAPEGRATLRLENGQALLQAASQAGLIPPQQMMGVQMMLGMMATPDGPGDRLKSEIEMGPGQSVSINGLKIR